MLKKKVTILSLPLALKWIMLAHNARTTRAMRLKNKQIYEHHTITLYLR
jgi:hypothetical protein